MEFISFLYFPYSVFLAEYLNTGIFRKFLVSL